MIELYYIISMKFFRYIIFFFIVTAFAFNSFGFIFYFLIERENAKEEAFERIEKSKNQELIEEIRVSLSEIQNGKIIERINKNEIKFKGRMYDIVKEVTYQKEIIFYCIHDEKEEKLEKDYSNNIQKNFNDKKAVNTQLNFNHLIQFAETGNKFNIKSPSDKIEFTIFDYSYRQQNNQNVLTPPPKF